MAKTVIMIVDDSISIRKQVKAILEQANYEVREAGSQIGMLNLLDQYGSPVKLVLMDLILTSENGFDLINVLRNTDGFSKTPVIILTEHSDRDTVKTAKLLGVNGYLVKPLQPKLLIERCEQALQGT